MARTTRAAQHSTGRRLAGRGQQRRVDSATRAAQARQDERARRRTRAGIATAVLLVLAVVVALVLRKDASPPAVSGGAAVVGGDLHTITTVGDALFVGGHAAAAVSRDSGKSWQPVPTLEGADAMGWAVTPDAVLAGGHPGLYRSTDRGATFTKVTGAGAVADVHALGGAGTTFYLASPQAGLLASTDSGRSWQTRNPSAGRSFMGTILVDPTDPARLIAPDMSAGLSVSRDGGRSWARLGGPDGAMAAAWNPSDTRQILAVGMSGGARSTDGGRTWAAVDLPRGVSAVTYSADGTAMYAAALDGQRARTFRSDDNGATWAALS